MKLFRRTVIAALTMGFTQQAIAAEIKVLCIPAWKSSFEVLLPQFEREAPATKSRFVARFFPTRRARSRSGDFDELRFAAPQIDDLIKQEQTHCRIESRHRAHQYRGRREKRRAKARTSGMKRLSSAYALLAAKSGSPTPSKVRPVFIWTEAA